MPRLVREFAVGAAFVAALMAVGATSALAIQMPTTGQPGAPANTCSSPSTPTANTVTPGAAASAPGSPFNQSGQAGNVYAGNQGTASLAHANSAAAVSQYDVACVQLSH
jgi:hypothetical protein